MSAFFKFLSCSSSTMKSNFLRRANFLLHVDTSTFSGSVQYQPLFAQFCRYLSSRIRKIDSSKRGSRTLDNASALPYLFIHSSSNHFCALCLCRPFICLYGIIKSLTIEPIMTIQIIPVSLPQWLLHVAHRFMLLEVESRYSSTCLLFTSLSHLLYCSLPLET